MSLPPINLLLPQRYTFTDTFTEFPLHFSSPSPATLLIFLLLHNVPHTYLASTESESSRATGRRSLLLNCYGKEEFMELLVDPEKSPFHLFFTTEASGKGKYLASSEHIDVVHVSTIHELRGILYALSKRTPSSADVHAHTSNSTSGSRRQDNEARAVVSPELESEKQDPDVPDSQASSPFSPPRPDTPSTHAPRCELPLLSIAGFDALHRASGLLSAQSLSRTLSAAIDLSHSYRLLIQDSSSLEEEIEVVENPETLPDGIQHTKTTMGAVYRRFFDFSWCVTGPGVGYWRDLSTIDAGDAGDAGRGHRRGRGCRVMWDQDAEGDCQSIKTVRD